MYDSVQYYVILNTSSHKYMVYCIVLLIPWNALQPSKITAVKWKGMKGSDSGLLMWDIIL
jgi:hypothetical protein